jgi:hypothetical protein
LSQLFRHFKGADLFFAHPLSPSSSVLCKYVSGGSRKTLEKILPVDLTLYLGEQGYAMGFVRSLTEGTSRRVLGAALEHCLFVEHHVSSST